MAYKFIDNYRERGARKKLVFFLREERKIEDEDVLKAIEKVPRHYFFDETFEEPHPPQHRTYMPSPKGEESNCLIISA